LIKSPGGTEKASLLTRTAQSVKTGVREVTVVTVTKNLEKERLVRPPCADSEECEA